MIMPGIEKATEIHDTYTYRGQERMNFAGIANRQDLLDRAYESFGDRVALENLWYNPTWTTYNVLWDHPECRLNNPHFWLYFSDASDLPVSFTFRIKTVKLTYSQSTYWTAALYDMQRVQICRLCWIIKSKGVSETKKSADNEVWNNSTKKDKLVGASIGNASVAADYRITCYLDPLVKLYGIKEFYLGLLTRRNISTVDSGTDPSVVHNAFLDPYDLRINF